MESEIKRYCVYIHINKTNGKVYVGQTCDIKGRWARKGYYYKCCVAFWNAIQKYGWDGFEHLILKDKLTKEEADYWEIYYINKYDARGDGGYNIVSGGQANNECHQKPVTAYNIKTGETTCFNSRKEASITLFGNDGGTNCIGRCIAGKKTQYKGFFFLDGCQASDAFAEIAEKYSQQTLKQQEQRKHSKSTLRKRSLSDVPKEQRKLRHRFPVTAYNYKTEELQYFNTPDEAQKTLFPDKKYSCVTPCLNPNDKQISYRFYYFFKGHVSLDEVKRLAKELYDKHYVHPQRSSKAIWVYDARTDILFDYPSIKDAAIKLLLSETTLRKYLKTKQIYNGYIFIKAETTDDDVKNIKERIIAEYAEQIEAYKSRLGLNAKRRDRTHPSRARYMQVTSYHIPTGDIGIYSSQTEAAVSLFGEERFSKSINSVLSPKTRNKTYKNYMFFNGILAENEIKQALQSKR